MSVFLYSFFYDEFSPGVIRRRFVIKSMGSQNDWLFNPLLLWLLRKDDVGKFVIFKDNMDRSIKPSFH